VKTGLSRVLAAKKKKGNLTSAERQAFDEFVAPEQTPE